MKHNIIEKRYRKTLDTLNFIIDDKYLCKVYEMETDSYCLRIYDITKNNEELYSIWFDETLGFVAGNDEQYTLENIDCIIDEAFRIIEQYIGVSYI